MIAALTGGKHRERRMLGLTASSLQQWIGEQEIGSLGRGADFLAGPDKSAILGGNAARRLGLDAPVPA